METLAYLQVSQEQEHPENKELTPEALKLSGRLAGTLLGAAGAAITVGLADSPAQAYGYGGGYCGGGYECVSYDYGCYDTCAEYLGGGYLVTSYETYNVSYDHGCYDDCYGGSYYGYDDYYGGYGYGGYGGYGYGGYGGYGGYHGGGCYDHCGISYPTGCYDYCGGGYGGGYGDYYGYGGGYGGGCYDYCGVSYGYSTYDIQVALNYAGFHVSVDGVYGPETDAAVVAFQHAVGLVPDGVVGPATAHALGL